MARLHPEESGAEGRSMQAMEEVLSAPADQLPAQHRI
jgi:hypothetical protein